MRKLALLGLFLAALWGASVSAQPAQKLVTVIVSPDRTDWQCKVKEEVTFNVQVFKHENLLEGVTVDYELGPECFPTVTKQDVVLPTGKTTLKASMKEPGFLRCRVTAKVDGRRYEGIATVGVDVDRIQPTTEDPKDFDAFWADAIAEARKVSLDPRMTLVPEKCTAAVDVYHVSFRNDRSSGSRIYGMLSVPRKPGKYPAVLHVPGAGVRPYGGTRVADDIISLEIGIHGIPVNLPKELYDNLNNGALREYHSINKADRDRHYYKRVYVGCVRAVDFIYTLPQFDGETVGVTGGSQGGAFTLVACSLDGRIRAAAPWIPFLNDFPDYFKIEHWPGDVLVKKQHELGLSDADLYKMLSYFDVKNFTRRITCPIMMGIGLQDPTCPPHTNFAGYNLITSQKQFVIYPECKHDTRHPDWDERQKVFFEEITKM